jgi:hypothetical protein
VKIDKQGTTDPRKVVSSVQATENRDHLFL